MAQRHSDVLDTLAWNIVNYYDGHVVLVQVPDPVNDSCVQPLLLQHHETPVKTHIVKGSNKVSIGSVTIMSKPG